MIRTETVLDSWRSIRADTAQAVEEYPPAEFDYRLAPDVMSFGEIARHVLEAGHALMGLLIEGVENMATPDFRQMLKKHLPALPDKPEPAQLAAELRSCLDLRLAQLAAQPPEFFSRIITNFLGQPVTRLEMIQFVKEHELGHRALLFLYLRLKGIVPVTTRRRLAKK
jgi:uncharacterized damage-inducible protein DinB